MQHLRALQAFPHLGGQRLLAQHLPHVHHQAVDGQRHKAQVQEVDDVHQHH